MRRKTNHFISTCANCRLNTYPATRREDDGEHVATEPSILLICDFGGPYGGFAATSAGTRRYAFIAVDAASRYAVAIPTTSTSDNDVFHCFLEVRRQFSGFHKRVSVDNALLQVNSRARDFLEKNGVAILHGCPYISRDQSKAEKTIGTISRLVCKYHTDHPELTFPRLVEEAVLAYNSSPCKGLPDNVSPRDAHFVRAPSTFLHAAPEVDRKAPKSIKDAVDAARKIGASTLANDVAAFVRRQERRSPTNQSAKVRVGDLCLKKRTSFPANAPRKLAFKIIADAYEVKSKVGSNSYRVESLLTGEEAVLPGDHLIKTRNLSAVDLVELCKEIERVSIMNQQRPSKRLTRSSANAT